MVNMAMPGTNWPYQETYGCDYLWMVDFRVVVVSLEGILNSEMGNRETQSIFNNIWTDTATWDSSHLKICIQKAWIKHQDCKNRHLMTLGLALDDSMTGINTPSSDICIKTPFSFWCSEPEMANVFWLCSTVGEASHCSLMPSLSLPQLGADQGRIVPGGLWEIQRFLDEQIIHFRWLNCFCHCFGIYLCT